MEPSILIRLTIEIVIFRKRNVIFVAKTMHMILTENY